VARALRVHKDDRALQVPLDQVDQQDQVVDLETGALQDNQDLLVLLVRLGRPDAQVLPDQ